MRGGRCVRILAGLVPGNQLQPARSLAGLQIAEGERLHERRNELLTRYDTGIFDARLVSALESELLTGDPGILRVDAPLTGTPEPRPLIQVSARFAAALVLASLKEAIDLDVQVARWFGLRRADTVGQLALTLRLVTLVERGRPPRRDWFVPDRRNQLETLATEARGHARILARRAEFLTRFRPEMLEVATDDAIDRLEAPEDTFWDRFTGFLHLDLVRVEGYHMPPIALSRAESASALRDARAIRQAQTWFAEHAGELDREFGHYESGAQTDWDTLLDALETVRQCSGLIDPRDPPAALLDFPRG